MIGACYVRSGIWLIQKPCQAFQSYDQRQVNLSLAKARQIQTEGSDNSVPLASRCHRIIFFLCDTLDHYCLLL